MSKTQRSLRRATCTLAASAASLALVAPATAARSQARERAIGACNEFVDRARASVIESAMAEITAAQSEFLAAEFPPEFIAGL